MSETIFGEVMSDERAKLHHEIALLAICLRASELRIAVMIATGDQGSGRSTRAALEKNIESNREALDALIDEYLEKGRKGEL
ncbi:hypothetical protein F4827_002553 [Paraburkholderia bannensis]|uniref:Uncharacterized protein n=1 Tax=Paraburkholderia bannensis TaxID=765414 RepID=A0A7W9WSX9_9BURK|nr:MULTISPECIES: hypothetical protein [Paraburkholderia]MBB3257688.1 hypothetical protein [Paraburkholderia sp. WP4_3_2]MBB6102701.1 hypothetical protein [Paraburkholderia bannensis]